MELFRPVPPLHPGVRSAFTSYYLPVCQTQGAGAAPMVAGTIYYCLFYLPQIIVDRVSVQVSAFATGNARFAAYRNENGMPTSLISDFGTVDTNSNAVREVSFTALALPDAYFWAAVVFDATPTVLIGAQANHHLLGAGAINAAHRGLLAASSYGAFPTTAVAPTGFTTNCPLIAFRRS